MSKWLWGPGLAALVVIGAGLWAGRDTVDYARIAVGYGAKQTCSCVFVAGRSLDECMNDFHPGEADPIAFTQLDDGVRASVLGVIRAEARFSPDYGCALRR